MLGLSDHVNDIQFCNSTTPRGKQKRTRLMTALPGKSKKTSLISSFNDRFTLLMILSFLQIWFIRSLGQAANSTSIAVVGRWSWRSPAGLIIGCRDGGDLGKQVQPERQCQFQRSKAPPTTITWRPLIDCKWAEFHLFFRKSWGIEPMRGIVAWEDADFHLSPTGPHDDGCSKWKHPMMGVS